MDARRNGTPAGTALVLSAAVLWGTVGPAQLLAGSDLSPAALGGWRLLVGGLALAALTVRPGRLRALASRAVSRTVLRPLLVCALATGLYQAAFLSSVARTGAALATVIALGTAPAATGLCARWVAGERTGAGWLAGTVAAVAGCALLLAPGAARVDPLGLLLAVTAGACYGLYTVFAKRLATADPAADLPALSAISLLVGAVPLLPWMVAGPAPVHDGRGLALVGWLGLVATAAAYRLFTAGLSRVRATTAGTLSLAEPLAAALIGVLALHERLSPAAWTGCGLILAGTLAACLPGRPRRTSAGPATATASAAGSDPGISRAGRGLVGPRR